MALNMGKGTSRLAMRLTFPQHPGLGPAPWGLRISRPHPHPHPAQQLKAVALSVGSGIWVRFPAFSSYSLPTPPLQWNLIWLQAYTTNHALSRPTLPFLESPGVEVRCAECVSECDSPGSLCLTYTRLVTAS